MRKSLTARILGRGSDQWKHVTYLTPDERVAVRNGELVYVVDEAAHHYNQSGYKIVIENVTGFQHREPNADQLAEILRAEGR